MSVSVNYGGTNYSQEVAFKGKWSRTEQGTPYYKSNSATITGGVLAVPAFLINYLNYTKEKGKLNPEQQVDIKKSFEVINKHKELKDMYEKAFGIDTKNPDKFLKATNEGFAKQKKLAIPLALLAAGLTLGSGMIVDHSRNKKAKETADYVRQVGTRNALMTRGNKIELSDNSRPYYKSNQGKKLGALLGFGCAGIWSAVGLSLLKSTNALKTLKAPFVTGFVLSMGAIMGLGGFIMGAIADSMTNSNAEKNA